MTLRPPDFDKRPLYHDGVGYGWVGYGMFMEWPSACFMIVEYKTDQQIREALEDVNKDL